VAERRTHLVPVTVSPAVVAVVVAVLALGGCTDDGGPDPAADPVLSPEEATRAYDDLTAEVAGAIAEVAGGRARPTGPGVLLHDGDVGGCVYEAPGQELTAVLGEDPSWDDVRAATEAVVADDGLAVGEQIDVPGGYTGFDAVGEDGARLEVRAKVGTDSTVRLAVPLVGGCGPADPPETLPPR